VHGASSRHELVTIGTLVSRWCRNIIWCLHVFLCRCADLSNPQERMIEVVRWFISSFSASRKVHSNQYVSMVFFFTVACTGRHSQETIQPSFRWNFPLLLGSTWEQKNTTKYDWKGLTLDPSTLLVLGQGVDHVRWCRCLLPGDADSLLWAQIDASICLTHLALTRVLV
jgi:hypothetical protein